MRENVYVCVCVRMCVYVSVEQTKATKIKRSNLIKTEFEHLMNLSLFFIYFFKFIVLKKDVFETYF